MYWHTNSTNSIMCHLRALDAHLNVKTLKDPSGDISNLEWFWGRGLGRIDYILPYLSPLTLQFTNLKVLTIPTTKLETNGSRPFKYVHMPHATGTCAHMLLNVPNFYNFIFFSEYPLIVVDNGEFRCGE